METWYQQLFPTKLTYGDFPQRAREFQGCTNQPKSMPIDNNESWLWTESLTDIFSPQYSCLMNIVMVFGGGTLGHN